MKPIRITTAHQSITFSRRMLLLGGARGGSRRSADRPAGLARDRAEREVPAAERKQPGPADPGPAAPRLDHRPQRQADRHQQGELPGRHHPAAARQGPRTSSARSRSCSSSPPDEVDRISRELASVARFPAGLGRRQCPLRAICRDHGAPARPSGRRCITAALRASIRADRPSDSSSAMSARPPPRNMRRRTRTRCSSIPGVKIGKEGLEKTLEPTLRGAARRPARRGHRARQAGQGARPQARPQRRHRPAHHRLRPPRICGTADRRPVLRRSSSSTSPTATSWRCRRCRRSIPTTSRTGSARPNGRCCRATTICRWSIRRWRAFIRRARRSSRRWRWRCSTPASTASSSVNCTGAYPLGNHVFHCDKRHGPVDMDAAVVHSCDVYFYTMCLRVGAEKLAPMVRSMGFGEKFDLPFDNQRYGTIPDPEWMMRKYHREWQAYDTVNMSIGQGMVLINPLQLAVMASRLATGKRVVPRLLKSKPVVPQTQLAVDQDHLNFIRKAMWGVVDHGTAAAAKLPLDGIQMAGKTGTAQTHNLSAGERGNYTAAQLEAARPLAVHGLRSVRQSALRGRRRSSSMAASAPPSQRRWSATPHCSSTTSKRRSQALERLRTEHRRHARRAARAQDRRVARGQRAAAPARPSRHDHLGDHPAAARAAAVALDLPRRGDRRVRP